MCKRSGLPMQKIFVRHWRWLQVNGTKQQAASCKRQAASLTRKNYCAILQYKGKSKNENK